MTYIDNRDSSSGSSDPRKATDILASIEDKLNTNIKLIYSYDLNVRLVLDRVNKIYNYIERLETAELEMMKQSENSEIVEEPKIVNIIPPEQRIEEAKTTIGQRRGSRTPDASPTIASQQKSDITKHVMTATMQPGTQASQNTAVPHQTVSAKQTYVPSDRKVPVMQRITDHTGKDLFMANITISTMDNEEVVKVKTNAAGKWQAQLRPGKYIVDMVKTDTATKNKIEGKQEITIHDSNSPITLPIAIIKR